MRCLRNFLVLLFFSLPVLLEAKEEKASVAKEAVKENKNDHVVIQLSSKGDDVAFDTDLVHLKLGHGLKIEFKNAARKETQIAHNIAILKPGSMHKVLAYFEEVEYDQEKVSKHPDVIAITPLLEPGQASELMVDPKLLGVVGDYPYVCLVPGHADLLGMEGILRIQ